VKAELTPNMAINTKKGIRLTKSADSAVKSNIEAEKQSPKVKHMPFYDPILTTRDPAT